jgi:hypothetical protein
MYHGCMETTVWSDKQYFIFTASVAKAMRNQRRAALVGRFDIPSI